MSHWSVLAEICRGDWVIILSCFLLNFVAIRCNAKFCECFFVIRHHWQIFKGPVRNLMKKTLKFKTSCITALANSSPLNHPNNALCTKKFVFLVQFLVYSAAAKINNQKALDLDILILPSWSVNCPLGRFEGWLSKGGNGLLSFFPFLSDEPKKNFETT